MKGWGPLGRRSATLPASFLFLQGRQALRQPRTQVLAQRRLLNQLQRLPSEGFDQQPARLVSRDAAGAQVKQRRLVEIADRSAMAAFNVIGIDFELWLGIDRRA